MLINFNITSRNYGLNKTTSILIVAFLLSVSISRWPSYGVTFDRENSLECFNWSSYEGGALTKVADLAILTVSLHQNQETDETKGPSRFALRKTFG